MSNSWDILDQIPILRPLYLWIIISIDFIYMLIYIYFYQQCKLKLTQIRNDVLNFSYCTISYMIQVLVLIYIVLNFLLCICAVICAIYMLIVRCDQDEIQSKNCQNTKIGLFIVVYYYFATNIISIFMRIITVCQIYEWESMKWIITW